MNDLIKADIGTLGDGRSIIPFFTIAWSLHDLIAYALKYTGIADVKLCTFSISEAAVRTFINLQEESLLNKLDIIIDHTAKKNKVDVMLFANACCSLSLADVHAKVVIIESKWQSIVIISSANLNTVKRYEAGVIFIDELRTKRWFEYKLHELKSLSIPYTPDGTEA